MDTTKRIKEMATNAIKSLTELKESTSVVLITIVTLMIILIALIYFIYYSNLKSRNCKKMDSIYGTLNGKIRSIDSSAQFNHTFKY